MMTRRDPVTEPTRLTAHARRRLGDRWPATVLPFDGLDDVIVPTDAPLVGYDGVTGASFLAVPDTPMVAVVAGDVVVTFLSAESARAKIALSGYGPEDFLPPQSRE